jgi:hypothetical protein
MLSMLVVILAQAARLKAPMEARLAAIDEDTVGRAGCCHALAVVMGLVFVAAATSWV